MKDSSAQTNWRLGAISLLYLAIFLTILGLAYTNHLPAFLGYLPFMDKAGHLVLYALAAYLGHRICRYHQLPLGGWRAPLFPALFGLFTLTEELLQSLSPYRTLDAIDLIASFSGIVLGWQLAERSRKRQ